MHRTPVFALLFWTFFCAPASAGDQRPVVAVFDVQTKFIKLSKYKRDALTDLLSAEIALGGVYQVMPPGDVKRALLDQSRDSYKECYDEKCQIQVGRQLPANKILTTTIVRMAGKCRVTGSLYDLKRQTTDTSAREVAGCAELALVASLEKVAARLREWGKNQGMADQAIGEKPVAWTPTAQQAFLEVVSQPAGLEILLDGKPSGKTPAARLSVAPGPHEVLVRSPCHYDAGKRFFLENGETKKIDVALTRKMGAIQVDARQPDGQIVEADVFVDGQGVGRTPGPHQVSVCASQLEIRHPSLGRWATQLRIEERQVYRFQATLSARPRFPRVAPDGNYDPSAHPLVGPVIAHLTRGFHPKERLVAAAMLEGALRTLADLHPAVLWEAKRPGVYEVTNREGGAPIELVATDVARLAEPLARLIEAARPGVAGSDLPALEFVVLNGALSTLDDHTRIIEPGQLKEMKISTTGEFGGVGVVIQVRDNWIQVVSPVDETPAWRAGLLARDRIVAIEGQSTEGMQIERAVSLMRGKPGTALNIEILRQGWTAPRPFRLVREQIKVKSVEGRGLGDGIGLLRVRSFGKNAASDAKELLKRLQREGPLKGLVLDLRANPGGLFAEAKAFADLFLADGTISIVRNLGKDETYRASSDPEDTLQTPMIVLVDRGTASASEMVAGSLRLRDRAALMGERTFGKGSVQLLYDLNNGFGLRLTSGEFLAGGEQSYEKVGITPDMVLLPVKPGEQAPTGSLGIRYPVQPPSGGADFALDLASRILREHGRASRLGTLDAAAGLLQELYNKP